MAKTTQCAALLLQHTRLISHIERRCRGCKDVDDKRDDKLGCACGADKRLTTQYMSGGDLVKALSRDMAENGDGARRQLSWYAHGRFVLLSVARGLAYLHDKRVRKHHHGEMSGCVCVLKCNS